MCISKPLKHYGKSTHKHSLAWAFDIRQCVSTNIACVKENLNWESNFLTSNIYSWAHIEKPGCSNFSGAVLFAIIVYLCKINLATKSLCI